MKKIYLCFLFSLIFLAGFGQTRDFLRYDSLYLTGEFILKNSTKDSVGFLKNMGGGLMEFTRVMHKVNDTMYLIGTDTLVAHPSIPYTSGQGIDIASHVISNQLGYYKTFGPLSGAYTTHFYVGDQRVMVMTDSAAGLIGAGVVTQMDISGSANPMEYNFLNGMPGGGGGPNTIRGGLLWSGSGREINLELNMRYTWLGHLGSHRYWDTAYAAIWPYWSSYGFGVQMVRAGYSNASDIWAQGGYQVALEWDAQTNSHGDYLTGLNLIRLGTILWRDRHNTDSNAVYPFMNEWYDARTKMYDSALMTINQPQTFFYYPGNQAVPNIYVDPTMTATFMATAFNTRLGMQNIDNNGNTNIIRFLKNKAGNYVIGNGTKAVVFDINGFEAEEGWVANSTAVAGASLLEKYFTTTNSANAYGERVRINAEGALLVGTITDNFGFIQIKANTATRASFFLNGSAVDVTTPTDGMGWYNSTTHALYFRDNGISKNLFGGGGLGAVLGTAPTDLFSDYSNTWNNHVWNFDSLGSLKFTRSLGTEANPPLWFHPDSATNNNSYTFLKVDQIHTYPGNAPFEMTLFPAANGDGTDDDVAFIGWDPNKTLFPTHPEFGIRMEYQYLGNGVEFHDPQLILSGGEVWRAMSWTIQANDSIKHSTGSVFLTIPKVEFRNATTGGGNDYFSAAATFGNTDFTIQMGAPNGLVGWIMQGNSSTALQTGIAAQGPANTQDLVFSAWHSIINYNSPITAADQTTGGSAYFKTLNNAGISLLFLTDDNAAGGNYNNRHEIIATNNTEKIWFNGNTRPNTMDIGDPSYEGVYGGEHIKLLDNVFVYGELHGNSSISTADPSTGIGKWMLGKFKTAIVIFDTAHYIEVNIDGTVYKLALAN